MKFKEILAIANQGYAKGDTGVDLQNINPRGSRSMVGDTLAEFVVREIHDTFDQLADDEEQIDEAIRVLRTAVKDLENTIDVLASAPVPAGKP